MSHSTIRIVTEDPETAAITISTSAIVPHSRYTVEIDGTERSITSKELTFDQQFHLQDLVEKGQAQVEITESETDYRKRVVDLFLASDPFRIFLGIIDQSDLDDLFDEVPHYFYEALSWNTRLTFDIKKARWLHLRYLREQRTKLFEQLDKDSIRAMETGDPSVVKKVTAKKQKLRDLPKLIAPLLDKANTVQELIHINIDSIMN